jgi:hypothetical protein
VEVRIVLYGCGIPSILLGDVEREGLGRSAGAGVLHVVHFAGHGAERLARLENLRRLSKSSSVAGSIRVKNS